MWGWVLAGDLFVIVASDGVWEFIESEEACQLVAKYKSATEACSALVHEAAARWKRFEGSYRDDITAIVAFLPFLEAGWADEDTGDSPVELAAEPADDTAQVYINMGKQGISYGEHSENPSSARSEESASIEEEEGEERAEIDAEFVARRLSVHNPFDEDWNDVSEKNGAGDDDEED